LNVDDYLKRIGLNQAPGVNLQGLTAIHRAHMTAIPYENLDVMLGRPVDISPEHAYKKIVLEKRGGWCYEMNGLLGYALGSLGFKVTRMAGAVMRIVDGELALANHLVNKIELDQGIYLADVGFGEGPFDPVAFISGEFYANGFKFKLSEETDGWWRLHKYLPKTIRSYDFQLLPADENSLALRCQILQSDPESIFVQNLLCYRHFEGGYYNLRGRVLRLVESSDNGTLNADSWPEAKVTERLIEDSNDLVFTLKRDFALDVPEAADLWPNILQRHEIVMQA